jgi:hypothetical protein
MKKKWLWLKSSNEITKEQYTLMTNLCWEVCRVLKNRSDVSFIKDVVGYRIIALRSELGLEFADISRKDVLPKYLSL